MNRIILASALACIGFVTVAVPADAKGCIKGAIVGGVAGSMVGHGKAGAAAGCAVGNRKANKKDKAAGQDQQGQAQ